MKHRKREQTP